MPENFEQTVDLSKKLQARKKTDTPIKKTSKKKNVLKSRAESIDEVYDGSLENEKEELQKIDRPSVKKEANPMFKQAFLIIIMLLFIFVIYLFFKSNNNSDYKEVNISYKWYAVKLLNDEIYYGEIGDISVDPILIKNVYYNYDQINDPEEAKKETGISNLRLVKRGKETHGPDGTMNVIRDQVVYMEPLAEGSKVLKAILEYEK